MKRLTLGFMIIVMLLASLTACSVNKEDDPIITMTFHASELSDEDYESVGTTGLEDPKKEDFKNIEFSLKVKHSNKITDRSIFVPDIRKVLDSNDPNRYWFGGFTKQDNPQENFALYEYSFVLYTQGLDEQGIRDLFKPEEVRISYTDKKNFNHDEVFKLSEVLQFKE